MKRIFILLAAAISFGASAQTTGELLMFSQNNFGISTARSAAMGGAFTSLGADASSMSINPAGLGLYRSGEVIITPQMRFENSQNGYLLSGFSSKSAPGEKSYNTNKFLVGNLAGVMVFDKFSIGFGFNRLGDFYSNSVSRGMTQNVSITDMFADQLSGIKVGDIKPHDNYKEFNAYPPVMWGSIIASQTYAVEPVDGYDDKYRSMLADYAVVDPFLHRKTDGALDEFAMSMAYNINDKLYIGATVGVQSLKYRKFDKYDEIAGKNDAGLSNLYYDRDLTLNGTGTNFKIGAIVRPVEWFRLGISYHSPTWMTIDEESREYMTAIFFDPPGDYYYSDTPYFESNYDVATPSRLLAGASATIANRAIISVDYKRTWNNKMSFSKPFDEYGYRSEITADYIDNYDAVTNSIDRGGRIDLNHIINNSYVPVNNYSVGVEGNLGAGIFLRAGYMYQDSPYKNITITDQDSRPQTIDLKDFGKISQYSAGIGYRTMNMSFDLAYVQSETKLLPYKYYSYSGIEPEGWATTKREVANIIFSVGFRF